MHLGGMLAYTWPDRPSSRSLRFFRSRFLCLLDVVLVALLLLEVLVERLLLGVLQIFLFLAFTIIGLENLAPLRGRHRLRPVLIRLLVLVGIEVLLRLNEGFCRPLRPELL